VPAVGKIPSFSGGKSWEERLKPLEKRLATKRPELEKKPERRIIEELGLRKLFR
jgi:hypothetical protein